MLLWRVMLLVGVVMALALGGVGVWENQRADARRQCIHVAAEPGVPSITITDPVTGTKERLPGKKGNKASTFCPVVSYTTHHHEATLLWYAAGAVGLVTLASMPLLRLRERR